MAAGWRDASQTYLWYQEKALQDNQGVGVRSLTIRNLDRF